MDARAVQDVVELRIVQAIEERFASQDGLGLGMLFAERSGGAGVAGGGSGSGTGS